MMSNKYVLHKRLRRGACLLLFAVFLLSTFISPASLRTRAETYRTGVVSTEGSRLNVRADAGTADSSGKAIAILGQLNDQTSVTVTGEKVDFEGKLWYEIVYGSGRGYVYSQYIRFYDPGDIPITDIPVTNPYENISFEDALNKEGFPESYKASLREIHKLYPNWYFKGLNTEMTFEQAVNGESRPGISLISVSSPSSWKATDQGAYDFENNTYVGYDGPSWVRASREIIMHFMDPRCFLDPTSIFQFLEQSYDGSLQSVDGVRQLIKGSFMENDVTDTDGSTLNYADTIYAAGRTYNVNPYVLAAMIVQEQGYGGTSRLISGNTSPYVGYFNYFNVGAYNDGVRDAVTRGLWYASQGSDGSSVSYLRPWNTRAKAINGGAMYYASGYINRGQNTLYLKKFNVQGSSPFTHQYMTNVRGALSEGQLLYKAYSEEMKKTSLSFLIPIYSELPETPCPAPTGDGSPNMKLKTLSVNGYSLTPDFDKDTLEYTVVVPFSVTKAKVTAEPYHSGASVEGAGEIELKEGTTDVSLTVTAENGYIRIYVIHIAREEDAEAGKVVFSSDYDYDGFYVTNVYPSTEVAVLCDTIVVEGSARVETPNGDEREASQFVATGDYIKFYLPNENQDLYGTFIAVVKGDVNGDGVVSLGDLVKIRNKILGSASFSEIQTMSGDLNADGDVTMGDLIRIRNYILGTGTIGG